jgi:phage baseplate assembly protein W
MARKFVGVTLPFKLGNTGMFEQSTDIIQQVRSNFRNLILTKKGERLSQPELGCDLWAILFQPLSEDTIDDARLSVVEAIDRWIPFIELVDFGIQADNDINNVTVRCVYRFRNNPNVTDQVVVGITNKFVPHSRPQETNGDLFRKNKTLFENRNNARRVRRP